MLRFLKNNLVILCVFAVCFITCLITFSYNETVALIELALFVVLLALSFVTSAISISRSHELVKTVSTALDFSESAKLSAFPLPVLVTTTEGKVLWFNSLFESRVLDGVKLSSDDVGQFLGNHKVRDIATHDKLYTDIADRSYSVYPFPMQLRDESCYALVFSDETQMRKVYYEYKLSRPSVMLICIDNIDELMQGYSDSDANAMRSGAEQLIDNWLAEYGCVIRKLGDGRFLVICEERDLIGMTERKFSILDEIRSYSYDDKVVGITLSIGISSGTTLREGEKNARQALDMAIGRGGDQAAILKNDSYDFFGGMSKGIEKRSKARTRIVASAIQKLMENSSSILIMGHRFSDLDSVGSAIGMLCAARSLGKPSHIVINRKQSLAKSLIDMAEVKYPDGFITAAEAEKIISKDTLLVIVDTHRAEVLESAELYRLAKTVIVIDHHRKNVDFINNSIVFQHDPSASSAGEMVSELLQYMPVKPVITDCEANALLAGIMLDTRNFALRAGVRTFEAAAFLRSKGADTVKVRRLFMNKMENFKLRNDVIDGAEVYRDCAIAYADINSPDIRTISAQAADEMLNIDSIKASFVMFDTDGTMNISARSLGEINVQVIMEILGGGGHQTMAAAQLAGCDRETATTRLFAAVDEYYSKL
ncbi:MAG: DHH family phosphoesterase [Acutalibacteraceae bacterium]|nr:DHH family phosphoesterase [Acutalibacteraceae bacterium]